MAFIVSLIQEALKSDLLDALDSQVDGAGTGSVTLGRLMDDPEGTENPIEILENDPENPGDWLHQQATTLPGHRDQYAPIGLWELGGSETWVRRFVVKFNVFLTREGYERDDAIDIINTVHGRIMHAVRNSARLPALQDEYGENVWMVRHSVAKSEVILSGGPPTSWIGRGKLWVQIWTQLP